VKTSIPTATIARLPIYLRGLGDVPPGQTTCSSDELAANAGVNSAQVRKDLSYLDVKGVRGVGYSVEDLRQQLRAALGLNQGYAVAVVGAGNLGTALSNYGGFATWGFTVAGVFDIDQAKVGSEVGGHLVRPLADLEEIVRQRNIAIGIIATPARAAQQVADRFITAGLRSILNFAPTVLQVPDGVSVRRVDFSTELQILTFHLQQVSD
jgi:redox-sensing transcriptional repressor